MFTLGAMAVSIAFFHSLAPDHWLPFVALAKSSRWSMGKLAWTSMLAGVAHVLSSLLIGFIGLWAGLVLHKLQGAESLRGDVAVWLLVGFGVAYGLWGLKHAGHHHPHTAAEDAVKAYAARRMWILFAVIVFGPCEPLIPVMFLAVQYGMGTVLWTSALFSLVTVGMVVGQSLLSYAGFRLIKSDWMEHYAHALAGFVIVLTGVFCIVTGV